MGAMNKCEKLASASITSEAINLCGDLNKQYH